MFFLEKIIRYVKRDKFAEILEEHDRRAGINPLEEIPLEDDLTGEEPQNCGHVFMPIDSTGEILACSRCGELKKKTDLRPADFLINTDNEIK